MNIDLKNPFTGKSIKSRMVEPKVSIEDGDKVWVKLRASSKLEGKRPEDAFVCKVMVAESTQTNELGFTIRTLNCLKKAEINTVRELLQKSREDLLYAIDNEPVLFKEIIKILNGVGINPDMYGLSD